MQGVLVDKATTSQIIAAQNGRQLGNINSGVQRAHYYNVQKDLQKRKGRMTSLQNMVFPVVVKPDQQANAFSLQGGQP